jgi:hypothetical protein
MAGRALEINGNTAPPTLEQIRQRAYELYVEEGCQPGRENENWFRAEAEFLESEAEKERRTT